MLLYCLAPQAGASIWRFACCFAVARAAHAAAQTFLCDDNGMEGDRWLHQQQVAWLLSPLGRATLAVAQCRSVAAGPNVPRALSASGHLETVRHIFTWHAPVTTRVQLCTCCSSITGDGGENSAHRDPQRAKCACISCSGRPGLSGSCVLSSCKLVCKSFFESTLRGRRATTEQIDCC